VFSDGEERLSDFDVALVEALVRGFPCRNIDRIPEFDIKEIVEIVDAFERVAYRTQRQGSRPNFAQL
jgi:hypothetical protein